MSQFWSSSNELGRPGCRWDMASKGEEDTTAPQRLQILRGHTQMVTAIHVDWAQGLILSAAMDAWNSMWRLWCGCRTAGSTKGGPNYRPSKICSFRQKKAPQLGRVSVSILSFGLELEWINDFMSTSDSRGRYVIWRQTAAGPPATAPAQKPKSATEDCTLRRWDLRSGELLKTFPVLSGEIRRGGQTEVGGGGVVRFLFIIIWVLYGVYENLGFRPLRNPLGRRDIDF